MTTYDDDLKLQHHGQLVPLYPRVEHVAGNDSVGILLDLLATPNLSLKYL
jgi:hypothetical protein